MRVMAGLWSSYSGTMYSNMTPSEVMFFPNKPFVFSCSLRALVQYGRHAACDDASIIRGLCMASLGHLIGEVMTTSEGVMTTSEGVMTTSDDMSSTAVPLDGVLMKRDGYCCMYCARYCSDAVDAGDRCSRCKVPLVFLHFALLDVVRNWRERLSEGERQRIQFSRLFARNEAVRFVVLDEATASVDTNTQHSLYSMIHNNNITVLSVGHRSSLQQWHSSVVELGLPNGAWRVCE